MIKKSKVLFLLHLPPPIHGSSIIGSSIYRSQLINKTFDCTFINILASKNIAETGTVSIRKTLNYFLTTFKVIFNITFRRPKICYLAVTTTGFAFFKDMFLICLLKLFNIKLIYHLHNKGISNKENNIINKLCYSLTFRNATVILLSKHLYYDVKTFVPKSRIFICSNGIADERKLTSTKVNKNLPTGTLSSLNILFLSNLIESKGIYILLEALALLKQKNYNFKCFIAGSEGDVTYNSLMERIEKLNLNNEVFYRGKLFGDDKNKLFSESDIFVFPTYYQNETFGLVLLEAMSHSLPIISTPEGGIPDVLEDGVNGFFVPQKSVEILAEKLDLLINDQQLRLRMGMAGRKKYENEFTLDRFEKNITAILNEVLSN